MGLYDSMNQAPAQGNGGSFAQKAAQVANPIMRGRPAMNAGPRPVQRGMRPNPMTGARPAMQPPSSMGMGGPRASQLPTTPLEPAKGLAPSHPIVNPSAGITGPMTPYDQSQVPSQGVTSLYGGTDIPPQENPQNGSQATLFGGKELQSPPLGGGGNLSFQDMLGQMNNQRPDVMPRGLGPSVIMDENGLEPRRAAR